jgi:hypothetical protein
MTCCRARGLRIVVFEKNGQRQHHHGANGENGIGVDERQRPGLRRQALIQRCVGLLASLIRRCPGLSELPCEPFELFSKRGIRRSSRNAARRRPDRFAVK